MMTRHATLFLPFLALPVLLTGGCARPQRTPGESAGRLSPPEVRYGHNPPGGVTMAPTGGGAGGSEAAGMEYIYQRMGGPQEQPVVSAPSGSQVFQAADHRMSPTTDQTDENDNSSGSGPGDAGNPLSPTTPLNPKYAPGADLHQSPTGTP